MGTVDANKTRDADQKGFFKKIGINSQNDIANHYHLHYINPACSTLGD